MFRESHNVIQQSMLSPVQDILLPSNKLVSELYIRMLSGYVEFDDERLLLDRDTKVSFNTYFNSFYESYWAECTDLSDLQLSIELSGDVVIEIFRDSVSLGCKLIEWKQINSDVMAVCNVKIPIASKDSLGLGGPHYSGRIFVDIYARRETTIRSIGFKTKDTPRNHPKITLGICTFNREAYLYKNLFELEQFAEATNSIDEIILVNQGKPFANEALRNLVNQSGNIRLIEQGNLGGCGGFTRTMYESLEREGVTHHVLMDDDANIDVRILANLESFLAHLSKDYVVGGHMLDLFQPWMLYEAGANVKANSRVKPLHHNIDLRRIDALHPFLNFHHADYNAWWFCAIPVKHIREAQFPAPIFIRGDDMEYGVRLQEKGVKTVAMPGIAVWHEPFYAKVGGWQVYYDFRNRMIMASAYPHRFSMESQGFLERVLFGALASHNYQEASLVIQAINDFLKGPALMNEGAELIHEKISVLARECAPQSVEHLEGYAPVAGKPMPAKRLRITALIAKRIMAVMFLGGIGRKRQTRLCMDNQANNATIGNFPYVKTNGPNTYRLLYAPNAVCLMKLLWKGVGALRAYRKNSEVAASKWRDGMNDLRGRDRWEQIFQKHNTRQETVTQANKSGGHASLTLLPTNRSADTWTHQKAS
jgi:galactofuranosylgalactofuranosylrhamnosyl-N-acetylglucosaminyl-diphospho-decaprenol beta-1,5/1,6-galactofuranosyltransferase